MRGPVHEAKVMTWRDFWFRDRPLPAGAKKVFLWWFLGNMVATYYGYNHREGAASFLWIGAGLGAIMWGLYSAGNKYRMEAKLTWTQFSGHVILSVLVLGVVVILSKWFLADWNLTAVLLVIGFYAAYLAGGLLVLYLAVRVVRAAWYRGHPLE
jgi:hypothetical protein